MENSNTHLIRYVRNRRKQPRGVIVATRAGVGWSLCCKRDTFTKTIGIKIALDRATNGLPKENSIPASIAQDFLEMENRRERYFKVNKQKRKGIKVSSGKRQPKIVKKGSMVKKAVTL